MSRNHSCRNRTQQYKRAPAVHGCWAERRVAADVPRHAAIADKVKAAHRAQDLPEFSFKSVRAHAMQLWACTVAVEPAQRRIPSPDDAVTRDLSSQSS
jgi:hypothetical protein